MTARGLIVGAALAALSSAACGRSDLFGESAGLLDNGGATAGSGRSSTGHGTGPNTSASNGSGGGSTSGQGSGVQGSGGTVGDIGTNSGGQGPGGGSSSGLTSAGSGSGSGVSSGGSGIGTNGGISGTGIGGSTGAQGSNSSGGSGASGGSGGSGGTGGAGPGGSTTTGGGCDATAKETPRKPCTADSDCGCPDTCVDDPPFGKDCERPCVRQSDCNDTSYVCNGTYCQFNTCGGDTGNGAFNSTCDVVGTNDGTCIPFTVNGKTIGECVKGGTATTCCNQDATPAESALLCAAGTICSGIEGGFCGQICDPFNPNCPNGQFCAFELNDSMTGGCFSQGQTSSCGDGG